MSYAIDDVSEMVCELTDLTYREEAFDVFRFRLLNNEAVKTPLGYAMLADQREAEEDSYGVTAGGDVWFVFSLESRGATRYFKVEGYQDSYDGRVFDGGLYEVTQGKVMVTEWKAVQQ